MRRFRSSRLTLLLWLSLWVIVVLILNIHSSQSSWTEYYLDGPTEHRLEEWVGNSLPRISKNASSSPLEGFPLELADSAPSESRENHPESISQHAPAEYSNGSDATSSWNRTLSRVCHVPPGEGAEEAGGMGYQVLYRMSYFFRISTELKSEQDSLLCVWVSEQADLDELLLEIYDRHCHGFLLVRLVARNGDQGRQSDGRHHSISLDPSISKDLRDVFSFIQDLEGYRWFHWTDPHRHFFIPQNLAFLLTDKTDYESEQPTVVQTWVLLNPQTNRKYHERFGHDNIKKAPGCEAPRSGNRAVVKLLKECKTSVSWQNLRVEDWIASCIHGSEVVVCKRPIKARERGQRFLFLRRYFDVEMPQSRAENADESKHFSIAEDRVLDSLLRFHAILYGTCDFLWDAVPGALDERGASGYIHDPYYIRNHRLPFTYYARGEEKGVCDIRFGEGQEGRYGYQGLKKIGITPKDPKKDKKLLCMVYTQSNRHFRVQSIAETWGPHCDGFFAASNVTDPSIGAVNLLHEGTETYDNMWMKIRAMFQYAYDNYLDDFELFHIGGDDHFLIPENLRHLISAGSWKGPWNDTAEPLFLGGSLAINTKLRYCNGGSGYSINRPALRLLVEKLFHHPVCMPHFRASYEDRLTAACFRSAGILCRDTNDLFNETRYHSWNVEQHASWRIGKPGQDWRKLRDHHGIAWKEGLGQISNTSVSFHLKNPRATTLDSGMRRYYSILYGLCTNNTGGSSLDPPSDLIY